MTDAMVDGTLIEAHHIALFVDTSAAPHTSKTYVRIAKSESLDVEMNPEVEERKFIDDEGKTSVLRSYNPKLSQDLTMYKGATDFEFFWGLFKARTIGAAATVPVLLVYMCDGNNTDGYPTWSIEGLISFNDMACVDSKLNFDILFGGDIVDGTTVVTAGAPVFTETA